jgi:hypothetical protein
VARKLRKKPAFACSYLKDWNRERQCQTDNLGICFLDIETKFGELVRSVFDHADYFLDFLFAKDLRKRRRL